MVRLTRRDLPKAPAIFAGCYLLAGTFIPWLVLLTDPLSACMSYCVLITSQYSTTVTSYWQYTQIPKSATLLDVSEVVLSVFPLAAAILALSFNIAMRDRSPVTFLRWGYSFVLVGALTMASFAFLLSLLTALRPPFPALDWPKLALSLVQLGAIITLTAQWWVRQNRLSAAGAVDAVIGK